LDKDCVLRRKGGTRGPSGKIRTTLRKEAPSVGTTRPQDPGQSALQEGCLPEKDQTNHNQKERGISDREKKKKGEEKLDPLVGEKKKKRHRLGKGGKYGKDGPSGGKKEGVRPHFWGGKKVLAALFRGRPDKNSPLTSLAKETGPEPQSVIRKKNFRRKHNVFRGEKWEPNRRVAGKMQGRGGKRAAERECGKKGVGVYHENDKPFRARDLKGGRKELSKTISLTIGKHKECGVQGHGRGVRVVLCFTMKEKGKKRERKRASAGNYGAYTLENLLGGERKEKM